MSAGHRPDGEARRKAFDAVVAAYEASLLRYAARLTANAATAEDVVQNAFVKLIRGWRDALEPSPQLSAWLYRVVHNEAVDHVRRSARRQALHLAHARDCVEDRTVDSAVDAPTDRAASAAAALARLPERDRLLVVLKVYEGKTYREIAELTGLSIGNVGFILHHAMKKLARALQQEEGDGRDPS